MSMLLAPNQLRQLMAHYKIKNAALFDGVTGYLSRTPAVAGNRTTWTWSGWVRRGDMTSDDDIFGTGASLNNTTNVNVHNIRITGDQLIVYGYSNGTQYHLVRTAAVFRDPTAFYHVVVAFDTTQSIASDRIKIYVNGVQLTSMSSASYPSLNWAGFINFNQVHSLSRYLGNGSGTWGKLEGYMAEAHFIDGQALLPTDFGKTDLETGNWVARKYTGTYGTNGFYLDFSNSLNIGVDVSGNSNNFTKTGVVTQVTSTPTDVAATLNPLAAVGVTLTNGNRNVKYVTPGGYPNVYASMSPDGLKGYFEWDEPTSIDGIIGFQPKSSLQSGDFYYTTPTFWFHTTDGSIHNSSVTSLTGYLVAPLSTERCGCAFDFTGGRRDVWFRNGTGWGTNVGIGNPASGAYPAFTSTDLTDAGGYNIVFGPGAQDMNVYFSEAELTYAIPTGFKALTTNNLPAITAVDKNVDHHFKTVLYTGTGVSHVVGGVGFKPDFVWGKSRSSLLNHVITDAARGVTKTLNPNMINAEAIVAQGLTAFGADGFTLGTDLALNTNTATYVAWCASLPNVKTSGWAGLPTITPTKEMYNADLGMSIVTYTGNGIVGATIPHSLGKKPGFVMVKNLDDGISPWAVYHVSNGATKVMYLNDSSGVVAGTQWNNTEPNSQLIILGGNGTINWPNSRHVAYIFTESDFIKIGSYIGNGSVDGPMINTGLRPSFMLRKHVALGGEWVIMDDVRDPHNPRVNRLSANGSWAENDATYLGAPPNGSMDFLSNGAKVRSSNGNINTANGVHIYMMIGQPNSPTENTGR